MADDITPAAAKATMNAGRKTAVRTPFCSAPAGIKPTHLKASLDEALSEGVGTAAAHLASKEEH
ncbi:hypothetical protein [Bifidobacterium choloepi]|uniref:Uncharacterized protein n=1 Tax=Bifidobacterium choloepi TaxID=2614131 RepID=A0A6I5MZK2_9BIFI|nr:hypothetical protein [Bifidobacterium choloepi]NEG69737.1 hypothetical protein [Bifidobacterium choloepi]